MAQVETTADGEKRDYMLWFPEGLKKVVRQNDFEFLRSTVASEDVHDCLGYLGSSSVGNIFHFAAYENNVKFMKKAMKILPGRVVQSLCCQEQDETNKGNPLHIAAREGHRKIVKVILDYYKSQPDHDSIQKPWLGVDERKNTPLHTALAFLYEGIALDILSMDVELLCNIQNEHAQTPTYLAVGNALNRVAVKILTSAPKCSLTNANGITVLFCAARASAQVCKMIVDKAPQLIIGRYDISGETVLHSWVRAGNLYPFEYVLHKNNMITPDLRRGFISQLCTRENKTGYNPLHYILASIHDDAFSVKITQILIDAYKQEMGHLEFQAPWLMEDKHGHTPLHKAIKSQREQLALFLFSLDSLKFLQRNVEHCAAKVDADHESADDDVNDDLNQNDEKNDDGDDQNDKKDNDDDHNDVKEDDDDDDGYNVNLLLLAINNNCPKVAEEMLSVIQENEENITDLLQLITFDDGGSALSFAPLCTATFLRQLLETHPEFIKQCVDDGSSVLHQWIIIGKVWAFKYILKTEDLNPQYKSIFIELLEFPNSEFKKPLHLAAASSMRKEMLDIVKYFLDASYDKSKFITLWSTEDNYGKTPLETAISNTSEDLTLLFLSTDEKLKSVGRDIMFLAIEHKCHKVVEFLLEWSIQHDDQKFLKSSDLDNILHVVWKSTEENGRIIVEKWPELINEDDKSGKKPLERASEAGKAWLVKLILQQDRSSIRKTPLAWVEACKKGHISTVLAFVENSPYFRSICHQQKDTPLHHIQKAGYKGYQQLLEHKFINEMKNTQNDVGETPLHIAIKGNNNELAEILLTDGVDLNLKDHTRKSVKDLLNEKCHEDTEWVLKAKYIEARTNLMEMRGTISVVATLLATITITAGFAVPGGVDSNGDAVLSGTGTFWVFVMSNTYAMCCAILILFYNTWSMVSDNDKSSTLIDRSLWLLKQSLYGTLVAFALAMYTVIHKKSLWAAIVVAVMVSLVVVLAQRRVLYKILDMLNDFEDNPPQIINKLMSTLRLQAPSIQRRSILDTPDDIENQTTEVRRRNRTIISVV